MSRFEDLFDKIFSSPCEFWETCSLFNIKNVACTRDGGGEFCGRWRELSDLKDERHKMIRE